MHKSAETLDIFVEHNQIESVEEIIAAPSWKKSNRLKLLIERVTSRLLSWL